MQTRDLTQNHSGAFSTVVLTVFILVCVCLFVFIVPKEPTIDQQVVVTRGTEVTEEMRKVSTEETVSTVL